MADKPMEFLGFKFSTMSPLAQQVVTSRVCSQCHKKSLLDRHCADGALWLQCAHCHTVFVLPAGAGPPLNGAERQS